MSLVCSLKGRQVCVRYTMLFADFSRRVCPCNCARAGPCAYCPRAVLRASLKMLTLVHDGAKLAHL